MLDAEMAAGEKRRRRPFYLSPFFFFLVILLRILSFHVNHKVSILASVDMYVHGGILKDFWTKNISVYFPLPSDPYGYFQTVGIFPISKGGPIPFSRP
jgi:hypothetical protein